LSQAAWDVPFKLNRQKPQIRDKKMRFGMLCKTVADCIGEPDPWSSRVNDDFKFEEMKLANDDADEEPVKIE
jgi:hypothetical protein